MQHYKYKNLTFGDVRCFTSALHRRKGAPFVYTQICPNWSHRIIPNLENGLLQRREVIVRASCVDVDNDDVYDLLSDVDGPASLEKRLNHDAKGPRLLLKGLTEIECVSTTDVW